MSNTWTISLTDDFDAVKEMGDIKKVKKEEDLYEWFRNYMRECAEDGDLTCFEFKKLK